MQDYGTHEDGTSYPLFQTTICCLGKMPV